jgi:hypothetical protein
MVIEVSVTTADLDREKRDLYAAAGVQEMWLVLPEVRSIEAFREPGPSGFRQMIRYSAGESVAVLAIPGLRLDLNELFS